jgi:hypothetical protein
MPTSDPRMKATAVIEFRATGKCPRMSENCVVKYRTTPVGVGTGTGKLGERCPLYTLYDECTYQERE